MAKKSTQLRPIIKLRSAAGTGYTYRLILRKFDPIARRHVEFKETR